MIAALGLYDRPETREATDRFWALIRDGLRAAGHAAPESLVRDGRAWMEGWLSRTACCRRPAAIRSAPGCTRMSR